MHTSEKQGADVKNQNGRKGDTRKIIKFDENEIPYLFDTGLAGVSEIRDALASHPEERPVKLIADLAGLGKLNNRKGRQFADSCLLKAIEIFRETIAGNGTAGSPSGDEFWAVYHPGASIEEARKNAENLMIKFQSAAHKIKNSDSVINLNLRVLISRANDIYSKGENRLKLGEDRKVKPGTIIVEKEASQRKLTTYQKNWSYRDINK